MTTSVELDGVSAAWDFDDLQPADDRGDWVSGSVVAQAENSEPASTPAETPPAATGEPVPVDVGSGAPVQPGAPGSAPATDAPLVYTADAGNVVRLPANISIENIRVEGSDLVLEQADGTLITIKDAAANVPTFIIGDVELPRVALLAALEASGVDVAFGADGSMAASPGSNLPSSSGGNFEQPPGGIGDGFNLSDLLPPTALAFTQYDGRELYASVNADPLFQDFSVTISEEGLEGANPDDNGFVDTTNAKIIIGNFGATDANGDPLTYSLGLPDPVVNAGIKSGGLDVVWTPIGSTILEGAAGGEVVIRITITNASTGDFQIELIGPFDHPASGVEDNLAIVIPVVVEDPFGGSKTANMTVVVEDDSPLLNGVQLGSTAVLDETTAGSPAGFDPLGITVTSALPILSNTPSFGADGPAASDSIVYAITITNAASGLQTAIGNFPITLVQTDLTTITGTYVNGGTQTAFTVKINGDGTLTVTQFEPLEHTIDGSSAAAHDDALTLSGKIAASVTITDFDGDSVGGLAQIGGSIIFKDDGPKVGEQVTAVTVDEDDIDSIFSDGSSPSDGAADGSDSVITSFGLAATVTGSLAGLVNFGADGAAETGGFGFAPTAVTEMTALGLSSQGVALSYTIVGDTLIAFADNGNGTYDDATDRTVFDLSVNAASGNFTFHQYDQLDHVEPPAGTADENTALIGAGDSISAIDFGGVIRATDSDGDFVDLDGKFTITIRDDVPVLTDAAPVTLTVDEDDIETAGSTGSQPDDGDLVDGSFTGPGGVDTQGPANATSGSLAGIVVAPGADDPLSFGFVSEATVRALLTAQNLKSEGAALSYDLVGNTLYGFANAAGPGGLVYDAGEDRLVFTLEVNPATGAFTFALHDQLDHAPGAGQNSLPIHFGSALQATDYDGDAIPLTGKVTVNVTDDVPVLTDAAPVTITVDEDDIETAGSTGSAPDDGDLVDGSFTGPGGVDTQGPANATSGSLAGIVVAPGADDPLSFGFVSEATVRALLTAQNLKSEGAALSYDLVGNTLYGFANAAGPGGLVYDAGEDRLVFTLEVNPVTGAFTFALHDQLDHAPGAGQNSLPIHFGGALQATDFDGDAIPLTGKVTVNVTDDVPVLTDAAPVTITVDEDDIETAGSTGSAPDDGDLVDGSFTGPGGVDTQGPANATSGSLAGIVVAPGADDPLSFGFVSEATVRALLTAQNLKSEGAALSYDLVGNTLYGFANAAGPGGLVYDAGEDRLVFTLEVNPVTGAFTFSLHDQLDHAPGAGQNSLSIHFGGALQATDFDGDAIPLTGKVTVNVTDDVPVLTGTFESKIVNEDDVTTASSIGTSPHWSFLPDGENDGDDSYTAFPVGPAITGGNLSSLVASGADDPVTFGFSANALQYLQDLQLYSKQSATGDGENGKLLTYTLSPDGNTIIASEPNPNGNPVFELELDPVTGEYEFRLYDELIHKAPPAGSSDENTLLRSGPGGATIDGINFGAIIEAIDADGDTVALDGVFKITILDDVPIARIALAGAATVIHDETPGDDGNHDTDEAEVAALFAGVGNPGDDLDVAGSVIGYARNSSAIVLDLSSIGADSPPYPRSFTLSIAAAGTDSGLFTTEGQPILLYNEDGIIVGRVGGANGVAAFAVHIDDDGRVSVAQYLSIKHDDVNDHDQSNENGGNAADHNAVNENPNPIQQSLAGKITATLTVTDSDGDTDTDSVDIGDRIRFQDDGPSVNVTDQVSTDEANQLKLQLDETKGADRYNGAEAQDGNGAADDGAGALPIVPKTAPATADAIGSQTTAVAGGLGALFNVAANYGADGPLANQQMPSRVDTLSFDVTGNGKTNIVVTALEGTPLDGLSAANRTVYLVEVSPGVIEGRIPGANGAIGSGGDDYVAFRISLTNPGNPALSQITVEQFLAVDHGGSENPSVFDEQINMLLTGSSTLKVVLDTKITDGDNDFDSGSDSVTLISSGNSFVAIDDDGPVMLTSTSAARDWTLDEDILLDGSPEVNGNDPLDSPADTNDYAGNAINNKPLGVGWGTDGAGTISFVAMAGIPTLTINGSLTAGQLSSGGVQLHYVITQVDDGQLLTAYKGIGGDPVFTLALNPNAGATGEFSFQLLEELDHASGNGQQALDITFPFTATDGDGDIVTSQVVIRVTDDVPYAPEAAQSLIGNGDFSSLTGSQVSDWWGTLADGATGWTLSDGGGNPVTGGNQIELVPNGQHGLSTPGGSRMLDMATSPGNMAISQTVGAAAPGQTYAITFYAGAPFPDTAALEVIWGGQVIGTIHPTGAMTSYSFLVQGNAGDGLKTLTLREVGTGSDPLPAPNVNEGYHGTYIANVQMLPVVAFVDEDALFGGIGDSQIGDVSPDSLSATGTLGIFWGSDNSDTLDGTTQDGAGAADTTGNNAALTGRALYFSSASVTATGTATMNAGGAVLTSKGDLVSTQLVENGTKLVGYVDSGPAGFDAGDRLVFDVTLSDDATGSFEFTLHDQLDHAANGNENDITLQFDYTARDFDGDTDTGSFVVGVDDDMPIVDIGVGTPQPVSHLALQLDESVQPDGAANPSYDRYNSPSEAGESGGGAQNGAADDVDPAPADQNYNQAPVIETAPVAAEAIGSRTTDAGKIGQLFTGWSGGQVGADDPAQTAVKTLGFVLTQGNADALFVATNLTATQTGAPELANHDSGDRAIYLHRISETVLEGRIAGADGSAGTGDDFVAFRITLNNANDPATATITVDQFMAIDHGADNPSIFDENLILELAEGASLGLKLDLAATDFDGDPVSDSATVAIANDDGSFVSFDDDGPVVTSVIQDSGLGNELIVNGSFENLPANTIGSPDWEIFHGIPGWTSSGGIPFEIQTGGAGGLAAQSGNALIELDSDTEGNPANNNVGDINATGNTNATIQQLVPGTVAGQTYELTFWYAPRAGDGTNSAGLKVSFGGVEVLDILANENPYSSGSWHQITLTVTATGPSSVLAFTGTGTENEHGAFLDNVSLKASYGNTIDDEDITPPGIGIDGGAGDDGAGTVVSGKINFDAGTDGLASIVVNGIAGLNAIYVDGDGLGHAETIQYNWVSDGAGGGTLTGSSAHIAEVFTLKVEADGDYTFTQKAPLSHPLTDDPSTTSAPVEIEFEDNLNLNFGFIITDGDGDTAGGTIGINVDDDTPDLISIDDRGVDNAPGSVSGLINFASGADGIGTISLLGSVPPAGLTAGGEAVSYWVSTDGATLIAYTGAPVPNGGSGPAPADQVFTLTVDPDGQNYTFELQSAVKTSSAVTDLTFNIKLTDGDGDAETGTISITLTDNIPTVAVPTVGAPGTVVDEKGLPDGTGELQDINPDTDDSETTTGSFAYTPGDGATTIKIDGVTINLGGLPQVFQGEYGKLTVTSISASAVNYTYTLDDNTLHHDNTTASPEAGDRGANDQVFDGFAITVSDAGGDSAAANLVIAVNDDGPVAHAEPSQAAPEGTQITGTLDFVGGADGAALTHINSTELVFGLDGFSQSIDIAHGSIKVNADGSYVFVAQSDDVYLTGGSANGTYTVKDGDGDTSTAGFSFTVLDDIDATTVSLTATPTITEAGAVIVYTATLSNPAQAGFPVTVTLSNNEVITIAGGASSGFVNHTVTAEEDVYLDPDSTSAFISTAVGGNFENLVVDATPAVTQITDTIDPTTVNLSASTVFEGAVANYVFTATLSNVSHGVTTIVTDQGNIIIADGQTSGTLTIASGNGEDVYDDDTSLTATITSATGGDFESLVVGTASATANVNDTIDPTTVNLSASTVFEGAVANYVFTATLSNVSHGVTTIVTDQGNIIIADGQTSGTLTIASGNGEDVYDDDTSLTAKITSATGGDFESLVVGTASATANVNDTIDVVRATLSAGDAVFSATGVTITYTVTLTSGFSPFTPTGGAPLTFTLANVGSIPGGGTLVIPTGQTSVSQAVVFDYDDFTGTTITNSIASVSGDEEYEDLVTAGGTTTNANTIPKTVVGSATLTVFEAALDLNQTGGDLAAGVETGTQPGLATETASTTTGTNLKFEATGEDIVSIKFVDPGAALPENLAGGAVTWSLSGDGRTLTMLVGGQTAIILALTGATAIAAGNDGEVTVTATLVDNLQHQLPPSVLDVILSGVVVQAEDVSGDLTTATVTVNVVDDAPLSFQPDSALLLNEAGQSQTAELDIDGDFHLNIGADGGSIRFPSSLDNSASGLTSGGLPITYSLSVDGLTLTASTQIGTVFTIELDPNSSGTTDTYTVNMVGTVDGGAGEITFDDLEYDFVGGNNHWAAFVTPPDDSSPDLLLTPIGGGTINTNNGGAGVGPGPRLIGDDEGIRLDFVRDVTGAPGSGGSGGSGYSTLANRNHSYDEHYDVNGASVKIGSGDSTTKIQFAAFVDADEAPNGASPDVVGDGDPKSITAFAITFDGDTEIVTFNQIGTTPTAVVVGQPGVLADRTFTVQFVDVDPTVAGVLYVVTVVGANGTSPVTDVSFASYTADNYNSLEVTHVAGALFELAGFGTTQITQGQPVGFQVPVELVDSDGDTVGSMLNVTLAPADTGLQDFSASVSGVTATANAVDGENIAGSNHVDTLTGDAVNNILYGDAGDDFLYGLGGADLLIGGPGEDKLTGGAGADTFKLEHLDIAELILDYSGSGVGDDGDVVDLTALFDATAATIDDYVHYDEGSHTLSVDVDGASGPAGFEDVAKFQNNPAAATITLLYDDGTNSHTVQADTIP